MGETENQYDGTRWPVPQQGTDAEGDEEWEGGRPQGAGERLRVCSCMDTINMLFKESRVGAERGLFKRAIHFCEKKNIPQIQLG